MKCCNFFKTIWISKVSNPTLQNNSSVQVSSDILPKDLQESIRSSDLQILSTYIEFNKDTQHPSLSVIHDLPEETHE